MLRNFKLKTTGFSRKVLASGRMELAVQIQIEELPEGLFLATSDQLSGLIAQGRTIAEALDIARDVAKRLIEARRVARRPAESADRQGPAHYTIIVAA